MSAIKGVDCMHFSEAKDLLPPRKKARNIDNPSFASPSVSPRYIANEKKYSTILDETDLNSVIVLFLY